MKLRQNLDEIIWSGCSRDKVDEYRIKVEWKSHYLDSMKFLVETSLHGF